MRLRRFALLFLLAACAAGPLAGEEDPLARRIDLDLADADLGTAVRQVTSRSHVDVLVGADVARPDEFARHRLCLEARNLTVRQAADWIARALNVRYRVSDEGRTLELTGSYDFLNQVVPVFEKYNLGGVTEWEERELFLAQLDELLKVYLQGGAQFSLRVRAEDRRLHAYLPPVLHERLKTILSYMAASGRVPTLRTPIREVDEAAMRSWLDRAVRADCDSVPLGDLLRDLAFQSNVNIGFDHLPYQGRVQPKLSLRLGATTLGAALEEVKQRLRFGSVLLDPPAGVWLSSSKEEDVVPGSRELYWENLPVQAYAVRPLAAALGAEALTARARAMLPLDARTDLSVGLVYHERTGNLIVIAPGEAQERIEAALTRLLEEQAAAVHAP